MTRADLLSGIVFLVLGVAVAWMSWEMPRLEVRRIHPATVPGLVPGILGLALAFCGTLLAVRSVRASRDREGWHAFGAIFVSPETGRAGVTLALALIYALGLVGRMPFWAATMLFVFAFIMVFERWLSAPEHPLWRTALAAAVQAVIVGATVSLVFQHGFLVRLP
ncbi:MAG: tripartite tricarboxylate transporter TctB family protein [Pararhodobacter sp.]|nr:tripartite tricarboxylate transporter TctB family protein [Pararhodobacter sp.]